MEIEEHLREIRNIISFMYNKLLLLLKRKQKQFTIMEIDKNSHLIPDALKRIAMDRCLHLPHSWYQIKLLDGQVPRGQRIALYSQRSNELITLWMGTPVIRKDVHNIEEGVSKVVTDETEWLEKRFDLSVNLRVSWRAMAEQLWASAQILMKTATDAEVENSKIILSELEKGTKFETRSLTSDEIDRMLSCGAQQQAIMLLGFAIENAAKGILANSRGGTSRGKKGLVLDKRLSNHYLFKLVTECEGPIPPDEKSVLEELTESIMYKGRYPASTIPSQASQSIPDNKLIYKKGEVIFRRLVAKLHSSLK